MSKKQAQTRAKSNQKIAYAIPLLVVGLAFCQMTLDGTAARIGQAAFTIALLGCVVRMTLNVRAARKA
ncbi:hypothetical protein [Streptomyces sp. cg35]|uniref:hypothetical protein n=1 Tax=Streptomyces sp. cg35 TaxID=3421650 RepID=UPI003D16856A